MSEPQEFPQMIYLGGIPDSENEAITVHDQAELQAKAENGFYPAGTAPKKAPKAEAPAKGKSKKKGSRK